MNRLFSNGAAEQRIRPAAFTLAEVLAALAFLAIVIPVAVEGLRIASRAGRTAQAKAVALRVADRVLNDSIVTGSQSSGANRGIVDEGVEQYRWTLRSQPWQIASELRLVTVDVTYTVQGEELDLRLSTLADSSSP